MQFPRPEELLPPLLAIGQEYEFRTFLIGVHVPGVGSGIEKSRLTRPLKEALGRMLEERHWPGREVDFERPELQLRIELPGGRVQALSAPLFIAGRYRKHSRAISSTHWKHLGCRGKGCPVCKFRGHFAEGSVGDVIGRPLLAAAGGTAYSFHGMGREDVDARMLGTGRPFVVEIMQPRRRTLDRAALRETINEGGRGKAEVAGALAMATEDMVLCIKSAEAEKSYSALVVTANPLPPDAQERIASLTGVTVAQRTPCRVSHRRAEKVRMRVVSWSFGTILDARSFLWSVRAGAGTYIKELASSDGGRTTPSLSELLGIPVVVLDLDVTAVDFVPPWERDRGPVTGS
jgi:tRNA pseudouridine synthase 10